MIGYKDIRKNEEINALIEKGNHVLYELGYTEHSRKHAAKVAQRAGEILEKLDYDKRSVELAKIAGYMHDIGAAHHDFSQFFRRIELQPQNHAKAIP